MARLRCRAFQAPGERATRTRAVVGRRCVDVMAASAAFQERARPAGLRGEVQLLSVQRSRVALGAGWPLLPWAVGVARRRRRSWRGPAPIPQRRVCLHRTASTANLICCWARTRKTASAECMLGFSNLRAEQSRALLIGARRIAPKDAAVLVPLVTFSAPPESVANFAQVVVAALPARVPQRRLPARARPRQPAWRARGHGDMCRAGTCSFWLAVPWLLRHSLPKPKLHLGHGRTSAALDRNLVSQVRAK